MIPPRFSPRLLDLAHDIAFAVGQDPAIAARLAPRIAEAWAFGAEAILQTDRLIFADAKGGDFPPATDPEQGA